MKTAVSKFNSVLKTSCKEVYTDVLRLCSGGRDAGSISEAGGTFKKLGVAREAQYFHKKERKLLENLKRHMNDQMEFHKKQIAVHQESLENIKRKEKEIKR